MAVWFTSDLHFGHGNIIRYSDRPFADAAAMDRGLIERWNESVDPADTVWVLGDVALGTIIESLALVGELNGRKLLLTGNHDRCWGPWYRTTDAWKGADPAKLAMWTERYLEAGFSEVRQGEVRIDIAGTVVNASHFPYRGDSHDLDRFVDERPEDDGGWLVHGHVHERWRQRDRMINVGVDVWDYRPVSETAIGALIANGPADLERLTTTGKRHR